MSLEMMRPGPGGSIERSEKIFLRDIEGLQSQGAGQLAAAWMTQYENLEDDDLPDFFGRFETFLSKRKDALSSLEVPSGLDEHLVDEIKDFDRTVAHSFGNPNLFQGNGGTAEVYEVLGHPHICVKYITNQARYNENNHLRVEFGLLGAVRELRQGRVRTPAPYFLRIHPNEGHSYGMEKVEGKSLSQILEKPDQYPELVALAKQLDVNAALEDLSNFVQKMHSERRITHNDLTARNIMLDRDGRLFIIDFGKAKRYETKEEMNDMQRNADMGTLRSSAGHFFAEIDKLHK